MTALDPFNNVATGYPGTIHFTSSDPAAVLPANMTLSNGAGTFSATIQTGGNQTLTATDTGNPSITGTSNGILVPTIPTGTTVTGRVVDSASHPVAGASVTVLTFSTTSAADGTFSIAGVPALNGNLVVHASATVGGVILSGQSAATAPVPGGITDVGSIPLTSIPVVTSISPKSALAGTTITAFAVGGLNLSGSTFAFSPSSGMTINGVSIAVNGTSATFTVSISAGASGRFTVVATNAAGASDLTPGLGFLPGTTSFNTLTVPGSDPNADPDKDGLTNSKEIQLGTDPLNADTDGDTYVDGLEVTLGSDPLNPNSVPKPYGSGWFASPIMSMLNNANPGATITGNKQYVSGLTFSMLNSLNPATGVAGSNHYVSSLTFSMLNNLNPSTGVAGSNHYVSSLTFSMLNNLNPSTGVAGSNHYVSSLTFSMLNVLNPSVGVAGTKQYVSSLTYSILNAVSPAPTTPSQRFVNSLVFSIANGVPARSAELVTSLFTEGTIAERAARPWLFLNATHGKLDSDGDGISDEDEIRLGTNPFDRDTDHDGYPDGLEIALGSDPLDPKSIPNINPPGFPISPAVFIQNYILLGMKTAPVRPAEVRRQQ